MLGIIMVFFSTFFDEVASSIAKAKLEQQQIGIYSLAVVSNLLAAIVFIVINILRREFVFSSASLPTLGVRAVVEVILTCLALRAIEKADRSTFGFIRVLTIPLLLLVDFSLGYKINSYQLAGIGLIVFSLFLFFSFDGVRKRGAMLSLATALLAVITLSLYKYNITHYNSVAAEQMIIYLVLVVFLTPMAFFKDRENPFVFLKRGIYCLQSLLSAVPGLFNSYAYAFAPASVIVSAYRSSSVFWSVVSGKAYFKERHILVKIFCLVLLVSGIISLAL